MSSVFKPRPTEEKELEYFEDWSPEKEYTADYAVVMEKSPDKDFVVLNLTDIHCDEEYMFTERGENNREFIEELVRKAKPDLITLSGDNAWSAKAYTKVIEDIDALGIPWAPIMGNHDGEGCDSEFQPAYDMFTAKNCLFKFGPKDMGYGNYIINITENGKVIHSLFMMDTHSDVQYTLDDGTQGSCYDGIWDNQLEWYKWAVEGIEKTSGGRVESTVIIHIPVPEYKDAWEAAAYDEDSGRFTNPDYADSYGSNRESVGSPNVYNAFFDTCKRLGSTKRIISGHDHVNDTSIEYQGIRLIYSLKCGSGGYFCIGKTGGTVISVPSDGHAKISNIHLPVKNAENDPERVERY